MKVTVDRDPGYAPCSYLLCVVDDEGNYDTRDEQRTVLFDSDWDFPSLAGLYGYVPCECGGSDGTVPCCGKSVDQMMIEATDMLDQNCGVVIDSVSAEDYFV